MGDERDFDESVFDTKRAREFTEGAEEDGDVGELEEKVDEGEYIDCRMPSGLRVLARKVSPVERGIWTDREKMRHGGFTKIFQNLTVKVLDPGPYDRMKYRRKKDGATASVFNEKSGFLNWSRVTVGDRVDFLRRVRIATYGPSYEFYWTCPEGKRRQVVSADLSLLPVVPASAEVLERLVDGNRFEHVMKECGKRVFYHLDDGTDEDRVIQMYLDGGLDDNPQIVRLAKQVDKIEGVPDSRIVSFLRSTELSDNDIVGLLDAIEENSFGVDTAVLHDCTCCKVEHVVELPFDQGYLCPTTKTATRRMERLRAAKAKTVVEDDEE